MQSLAHHLLKIKKPYLVQTCPGTDQCQARTDGVKEWRKKNEEGGELTSYIHASHFISQHSFMITYTHTSVWLHARPHTSRTNTLKPSVLIHPDGIADLQNLGKQHLLSETVGSNVVLFYIRAINVHGSVAAEITHNAPVAHPSQTGTKTWVS